MGATRQINYGSISNVAAGSSLFSSAETWGELKKTEPNIATLASGMSAVLDSGAKLTSDSDSLPEGDFSLYFVLEKNNSGNDGNN